MWQAVTQLKGTFSPVLVQSNAHFFSSTFSMALSASAKSVKRTCIHWILRKRSLYIFIPPFCKYKEYCPKNYTVPWRIRWHESAKKGRWGLCFWKLGMEIALLQHAPQLRSDTLMCKMSCVSPRITFTPDHLCCWITNNALFSLLLLEQIFSSQIGASSLNSVRWKANPVDVIANYVK